LFFAEDDDGNIGMNSVIVRKSVPTPPAITGYEIFLILGVISLVSILLAKKIKSK